MCLKGYLSSTSGILSLFILMLVAVPASFSQPLVHEESAKYSKSVKWERHTPRGETSCALGSKFQYFTRLGDPQKLVIYFAGGGACWNGQLCDPSVSPTPYTYKLGTRSVEDIDGIFNLDHPENPLANYTFLAAPTCTGDLFLGDSTTEYRYRTNRGKEKTIKVHHKGMENALATLQWAYENVKDPEIVVVGGSSAGGVAVPFYANIVANHYPQARVIGIGDAAGAYRQEAMQGADFSKWNIQKVITDFSAFHGLNSSKLGIEDLYIEAAEQGLTNLELYQVDQAYDKRQQYFLSLAGSESPNVRKLIEENYEEISSYDPDFRSFLLGGSDHTIFTNSRFYFYGSDGMLFREWLNRILVGATVENKLCSDCSRPELHYSETDLNIVKKVKELLATEKQWNNNDRYPHNQNCRQYFRGYSLRCAVDRASEQVGRDDKTHPVSYAFLYAIRERDKSIQADNYLSAFASFNNHPERTYEEVVTLISDVEDEVRQRLGR